MVHFFVGVGASAVLWLLVTYVRRNELRLNWWRWALTVLGLAYAVSVVEVIVGFPAEGEPRAALVMGILMGIVVQPSRLHSSSVERAGGRIEHRASSIEHRVGGWVDGVKSLPLGVEKWLDWL